MLFLFNRWINSCVPLFTHLLCLVRSYILFPIKQRKLKSTNCTCNFKNATFCCFFLINWFLQSPVLLHHFYIVFVKHWFHYSIEFEASVACFNPLTAPPTVYSSILFNYSFFQPDLQETSTSTQSCANTVWTCGSKSDCLEESEIRHFFCLFAKSTKVTYTTRGNFADGKLDPSKSTALAVLFLSWWDRRWEAAWVQMDKNSLFPVIDDAYQ